ncbi:UNVERIFIED_CONTAM: glyoxalase-like domain protein [Hammondia hammondi]|eukprot:XP_008887439.1 glyoxalase-like domain protein [Hammondia hammondi]
MEKLPTIILPGRKAVDEAPLSGRSGCAAKSSPSSSSSNLPLPEASQLSRSDSLPGLVRFVSLRLRARKSPQLAEDFYVRRMGMTLLQPAVPQSIACLEGGALNRSRSGSLPRVPIFSRSSSSLGSACARRVATNDTLETVELKLPHKQERVEEEKQERVEEEKQERVEEEKQERVEEEKQERVEEEKQERVEEEKQERVEEEKQERVEEEKQERVEEEKQERVEEEKQERVEESENSGGKREEKSTHLSPQESLRSGSLRHAGSGRLCEEEERHWLLKKKRCPCAVGYNYDREVSFFADGREDSDQDTTHIACTFKGLHHELLLEIVSPDAEIPDDQVVPYHHQHSHTFSRVAFSVADVNAAQVALSSQMLRVGNAAQFTDVNFAVTFLDPENFRGRILQHLSEYAFARRDGVTRSFHRRTLSHLGLEDVPPLGSRGTLHHVEFRVRDIGASLAFYQKGLQLRLISKQAVPSFGITFFFLTSDPNATPPAQCSLDSHDNRVWLWDRKFSSICLKSFTDKSVAVEPYRDLAPGECGFLGLTFLCKQMNVADLTQSLEAVGAKLKGAHDPVYGCRVLETRDPENIPVRIVVCPDALWAA